MQKAVIDMGTNTFHMLVAERNEEGEWVRKFGHRVYVKLAEEGLGEISPAGFQRGLSAMQEFRTQLDNLGLDATTVKAYGTAALRSAANGADFFSSVLATTGIAARAITGQEEARLIYRGVRQAVPWPEEQTVLIMDIGGGSVEFILADKNQVFWEHSFNVGVALLHRSFNYNDPVHPAEIMAIEAFLNASLEPLWQALARYPSFIMVGAAGAFDTIDLFALDPATKPLTYGYLERAQFRAVYDLFVKSTLRERLVMPLLLPERVDMVVASVILIRFILERAGIQEIYTSTYSMKEGMLVEE
ncbi:MAG: phosphatase [Lewinellaceae bacterium]|nr:phosphatase [Lewinellaceae bacterium]